MAYGTRRAGEPQNFSENQYTGPFGHHRSDCHHFPDRSTAFNFAGELSLLRKVITSMQLFQILMLILKTLLKNHFSML